MKKWFEIVNKADKAEIWIYESIGEDWWSGGGMTAKSFQKELSAIKASQIDLHINSPGGEVFDGITIYNLIKQHAATVTTYIDGLAASIASVIALAGDKIIMADNALYMIHNPFGYAQGDAETMRKMADALDKVAYSLVTAYISKTGKTDAEISELMAAETWMTAQEAMDNGFVDEIGEQMDMAACGKFVPVMVKAQFKHIPENLAGHKNTPTPAARDLERTLRDAGCSRAMAKAILAEGYPRDLRDADAAGDDLPGDTPLQRDAVPPPEPHADTVAYLLAVGEKLLAASYT